MDILYKILIEPIEWIIGGFYEISYDLSGSYGISIILTSILVSTILLPIYKYADNLKRQDEEERSRFSYLLGEIKRNYKGAERQYYISYLYKQNNYSPLKSLRVSIGFLIQIPFFFAAYHFFINYPNFKEQGFWIIRDLSRPDYLWAKINVLPWLMTLLNIISAQFILRNADTRTKLQVYGIAIFFLYFLYDSPSSLLLYWTMNNLYSLIKNIIVYRKEISLKGILKGTKTNWDNYKQSVREGFQTKPSKISLIISLFTLLNIVFIYSPLYVYLASPKDLGGSLLEVLGLLLLVESIIFIPLLLIIHFIFKTKYKDSFKLNYLKGFIDLTIILMFFYGFIFNLDLGELRGGIFLNQINLIGMSNEQKNLEGYILLLVILCFLVLYKSLTKHLNLIYKFLNLFFIVSVVVLLNNSYKAEKLTLTNNQINALKSTKLNKQTIKNQLIQSLSFSKHKNILVLVFDATRGDLIRNYIKQNPKIRNKLKGFVLYENSVSTSSSTSGSIFAMLLGNNKYSAYEINKKYNYSGKNINDIKIIVNKKFTNIYTNDAYNLDYSIDYITSENSNNPLELYYQLEGNRLADNIIKQNNKNNKSLRFGYLVKLSFFRISPLFLKRDLYRNLTSRNPFADIHSKSHLKEYFFYKNIHKFINNKSNKPTIKFIWTNFPSHSPFILNSNHKIVTKQDMEKGFDIVRNSKAYIISVNYIVKVILAKIVMELKKLNIYDQTKIIIASDHGARYYGDKAYKNWENGAIHSLLMVKDFNDNKPYKESSIPVMNSDLPAIIGSGIDRTGYFNKQQNWGYDPIINQQLAKNRERNYYFVRLWSGRSTGGKIFDISKKHTIPSGKTPYNKNSLLIEKIN